ncbi:hypothetical protein RSOL_446830 [Rhizoctonia solani AG-3 Rhs1AP]|uniref:Uncharacterized protein n=1 Tax=Rhizoctonia solani AG-3 Rhs1AP TaxID=1086054 RepID=X8JNX5_9AGAM|nr:hypothetical protein RSOL_446830 [Rhizoctonia solani AG-3 Rhs1AP]
MMYLGSLGTQLLFIDHYGRPLKFYIHESVVGDSRYQVEHFITTEGGIIVNAHWEANFTLVQPGLPGVSELHGAAELILRFDWVYACVNSHRMLCDGDWAGFLIAQSPTGHSYTTPGHNYLQHPYTTPYQTPMHHPPAHSYAAPTLNHTHSYLAPPSYTVPNYTTQPGPPAPTHHAPPYHSPTYSGLGLGPAVQPHYQPPYRTLAHAPMPSTTSLRALHPNTGPVYLTPQEQPEPRLGVESKVYIKLPRKLHHNRWTHPESSVKAHPGLRLQLVPSSQLQAHPRSRLPFHLEPGLRASPRSILRVRLKSGPQSHYVKLDPRSRMHLLPKFNFHQHFAL